MKLAIVDIETTSLKGDTGFLLCAGVKPLDDEPVILELRKLAVTSSRHTIDRRLARELRDVMERYDGWITWNGLLFDLPYINDRLLICGERPLEKRFARGLDMMYHAKIGKSTFQSAKLDWVMKAFRCPYRKTDLDLSVWKEAEAEALRGFRTREAYRKILDHNYWDLYGTEFVFHKLKGRIQTISKW